MNVTKIILTRCQIFHLKCTKFNFAALPRPVAEFGGRGMEVGEEGRKEERKGGGREKGEGGR